MFGLPSFVWLGRFGIAGTLDIRVSVGARSSVRHSECAMLFRPLDWKHADNAPFSARGAMELFPVEPGVAGGCKGKNGRRCGGIHPLQVRKLTASFQLRMGMRSIPFPRHRNSRKRQTHWHPKGLRELTIKVEVSNVGPLRTSPLTFHLPSFVLAADQALDDDFGDYQDGAANGRTRHVISGTVLASFVRSA